MRGGVQIGGSRPRKILVLSFVKINRTGRGRERGRSLDSSYIPQLAFGDAS